MDTLGASLGVLLKMIAVASALWTLVLATGFILGFEPQGAVSSSRAAAASACALYVSPVVVLPTDCLGVRRYSIPGEFQLEANSTRAGTLHIYLKVFNVVMPGHMGYYAVLLAPASPSHATVWLTPVCCPLLLLQALKWPVNNCGDLLVHMHDLT